jgi:PIN domain nuclease of toxin-antitoxin system
VGITVLLDTHALLWWLTDDPSLSQRAKELIKDPDNKVLVSSASAWEIATKYRIGKLPGGEAVAPNLSEILRLERMEVLSIGLEHALLAGRLERPHRDPFDRMLAAQAILESVPIISRDSALLDLGTTTVW